MKTTKALLLVIITISFLACDGTSPNNNTMQILPLNIGNKWIYSVKSETDSVIKTNQIYKDTLLQSEKWFIMTLDGVPVFLANNKNDGTWLFRKSTTYPEGKPVLFYKYPATVGETYDIDSINVSILSIKDTISVIGGTYICYRYQTLWGQYEKYDEYFAPGVGAIKIVYYKFNSGKWEILETTEFVSAVLK